MITIIHLGGFMSQTAHRMELLDSLMHTNVKRMIVGIIAGCVAGVVMLIVTMAFNVEGAGTLWWLKFLGSAFFGHKAFLIETSPAVITTGLFVHFFLSALCGFIVGKMTVRNDIPTRLFYTFVLGFLCWLASNMFGPDFFDYQFLTSIGQWLRLLIFMSFTLSLGLIFSVMGKALKV